jgi:RimJ/RimL family protein N-acetyltransferase
VWAAVAAEGEWIGTELPLRAGWQDRVRAAVTQHNVRARGLYEAMGFVDEGLLVRHDRRNSGALWDVVAMALVLDTTSPGRP